MRETQRPVLAGRSLDELKGFYALDLNTRHTHETARI
jgi:hypothetical protein